MTREEVIDFCDMKSQLEPENEDIFNYIVKILEQEPVLDKIRAEIIELRSRQNVGALECLDIIDKYKAESEDKE